jgi:YesN/AraC family two-component response regulator
MPPGWDGVETIRQIWQISQNLQTVICTAFSDYSWEQIVGMLGKRDNLFLIRKPFDPTAVRQLAFRLSERWNAQQAA